MGRPARIMVRRLVRLCPRATAWVTTDMRASWLDCQVGRELLRTPRVA